MKTLKAIRLGSNFLKQKKIPTYILDSELLLSETLNKPREKILINLNSKLEKKNLSVFKKYLIRRSKNEPLAYILGKKEFWSKNFSIKDTLIPRPETELLVDALVKKFKDRKITIIDIGTGSGCIILSLLSSLKESVGVGVDISKNAIYTARKNAVNQNLSHRVKFSNRSLNSVFGKKFDLVVSNPPYIVRKDLKNLSDDIKKYEPRMALDGGNDGLDFIKKVIYKSKEILKINGTLALEIGNRQIKKVSKILIDNNFRVNDVIKDYKNNIRCVIANNN